VLVGRLSHPQLEEAACHVGREYDRNV
jgi:hypothetical protein